MLRWLLVLLLTPFAFAQTPQDGLVAYYPFQENAQDASGSGNNAQVHGATLAEGHDGEAGSAYRLDGTNDYLVVPHSESLSLSGEPEW